MIHDEPSRRLLVVGIILTILFVAGCDSDWAKRLEYGEPLPEFRFSIELDKPIPKKELFYRLESLAHSAGFTNYRGRPISDDMLDANSKYRAFDWYPSDETKETYSVGFIWSPHDTGQPTSVIVIFRNKSVESFGVAEWLLFKDWRDLYLPMAFPKSEIEITLHPARYTNKHDLDRISEATGISVTP